MNDFKIPNLQIQEVAENVLLIHQIKSSALFTCCDGLLILPKQGRNKQTIILDLNVEPENIKIIYERFSPISDYVCSHTHLDHSAHVYAWEELGVEIYAPFPEYDHLLGHEILLEKFGFLKYLSLDTGKSFVEYNGYKKCRRVKPFQPGSTLQFEKFVVNTLHLSGHSFGHVGFFLPKEKIFHISCLGFDQPKPGIDSFGPWYGFETNSLEQYEEDIRSAEEYFLDKARFLTSSHSYIIKHPDITPFQYMRRKIRENQKKVDEAVDLIENLPDNEDELVNMLLELDLFFPKRKMRGFLFDIYTLWESWFIRNHLRRNERITY
ncbi:MAG: MBL fold metallo-hydrolase [Promethearchaeota archaeon]